MSQQNRNHSSNNDSKEPVRINEPGEDTPIRVIFFIFLALFLIPFFWKLFVSIYYIAKKIIFGG